MYMVVLSAWNLRMHSVPLKAPQKKKRKLEFSLDLEKLLFSLVSVGLNLPD